MSKPTISGVPYYRGICWGEDTLIKDGTFSLPGRKVLLKSDVEYEVILVDATETPIDRPQKTEKILLRKEKTSHLKNSDVDKSWKRKNYLFGVRKRERSWFPAVQKQQNPLETRNATNGKQGLSRPYKIAREFHFAEKSLAKIDTYQNKAENRTEIS